MVGQMLTLECSVFTVRGVNSNIDVIWQSDDLELGYSENISVNTTTNNSLLYIDIYTISQLSTADEGKTYQCYVLIDAISPIAAYNNVTLNITGKNTKHLTNVYNLILCICSSLHQHCYVTIWSHTRSYGR